MVTIIIPGFSAHNKKWLEDVTGEIKSEGEIRPIYWGHWNDPDISFNPVQKANLLDGISGKRVVDIVAKSIGTLVASYLIRKSPEKIRKVIFCGIPINDISEDKKEVIKDALSKISPENIVCIQNDEDPHASFDMVKNFLSEFGDSIQVISKPGSDHEYFYQEDFNKFLLG